MIDPTIQVFGAIGAGICIVLLVGLVWLLIDSALDRLAEQRKAKAAHDAWVAEMHVKIEKLREKIREQNDFHG